MEDAEARASMLELTVELGASVEEEMSGICVGIWKMVSNRVTYMPFTRFYKSMYIYTYKLRTQLVTIDPNFPGTKSAPEI